MQRWVSQKGPFLRQVEKTASSECVWSTTTSPAGARCYKPYLGALPAAIPPTLAGALPKLGSQGFTGQLIPLPPAPGGVAIGKW